MHRIISFGMLLWALLINAPSSNSQVIQTLAGTGSAGFTGDNLPAIATRLNLPTGACPDQFGNIYIADRANHRIRRIDANSGVITTIAGTGTAGFLGDGGLATEARLNNPVSVALALDGSIYIAEQANHRIRKIDASGIISTLAGNGTAGFAGDGVPAQQAQFSSPWGISLDIANNLYIADRDNNRVRKIDLATGIITTVAGSGASGSAGDGGAATAASLNKPISVCVDTAFNIYFADENNHRVRKVTQATGIISTIAGTGTAGYNGDGIAATAARLNFPSGVGIDLAGNVYISDRTNQRLRKINTSGIISTIAGTGSIGAAGDGGNATSAQLNYPRELFSDGSGNIYFADTDNNRIRKITYCALPTIPQLAANTTNICAGESASLSISTGLLNAALEWKWYAQDCGGDFVASGTAITVSPNLSTTYFVRGEGGCVTPYGCAQITINVAPLPALPSEITASNSLCANQPNQLSVNAQAEALSYVWTLPEGWSGSASSNSIFIETGSLGGSITVYAQNACGAGPTQTLEANIIPVNTAVLDNGGLLSAQAQNAEYQWLNCSDFNALDGETNPEYFPTLQGSYAVAVTENGCTDTSACIEVLITEASDVTSEFKWMAYPNPVNDLLQIEFAGTTVENLGISLYAPDGRVLMSKKLENNSFVGNAAIDLSSYCQGIYFIVLHVDGNKYCKTVTKL